MKLKLKIAAMLLSAAVPGLATAQEMSGGITLGFGMHEFGDPATDIDTASLDGRVNLGFENGVTLGITGGYIDLSPEGTTGSLNGDFIGLDLGYRLSSGVKFGVYAERLTIGISGAPFDISLDAIGLSAGYEVGQLDTEIYFGRTSLSPDLIGNTDVDNFGISAQYEVQPGLDVAGSFQRATLSVGPNEADIDMFGLAAAYDINEQFSIFGGLNKGSLDEADLDVTTFGLGVGYNLPAVGGVASTLSLELARTELSAFGSSEDLDTIRLGLTVPLGEKGTESPLNSVADSVFNPRHGSFNTLLTGAF